MAAGDFDGLFLARILGSGQFNQRLVSALRVGDDRGVPASFQVMKYVGFPAVSYSHVTIGTPGSPAPQPFRGDAERGIYSDVPDEIWAQETARNLRRRMHNEVRFGDEGVPVLYGRGLQAQLRGVVAYPLVFAYTALEQAYRNPERGAGTVAVIHPRTVLPQYDDLEEAARAPLGDAVEGVRRISLLAFRRGERTECLLYQPQLQQVLIGRQDYESALRSNKYALDERLFDRAGFRVYSAAAGGWDAAALDRFFR